MFFSFLKRLPSVLEQLLLIGAVVDTIRPLSASRSQREIPPSQPGFKKETIKVVKYFQVRKWKCYHKKVNFFEIMDFKWEKMGVECRTHLSDPVLQALYLDISLFSDPSPSHFGLHWTCNLFPFSAEPSYQLPFS